MLLQRTNKQKTMAPVKIKKRLTFVVDTSPCKLYSINCAIFGSILIFLGVLNNISEIFAFKMAGKKETKVLGVEDAFQYFAQIKSRYYCEPYIYRYFVGIINEYKHGRIGIVGLVQRIRVLFEDHPDLVEKFNEFLPARHRVFPLPQNNTESTHEGL